MKLLTIDDFELKGKTVFLRVDMNCPINPDTMEITGTKRIEEATESINAMNEANHVLVSEQNKVLTNFLDNLKKEYRIEIKEELLGRIQTTDDFAKGRRVEMFVAPRF